MIYSIQYLRMVASLAVVFAHSLGGLGDQGVDIFFVISGYIVLHLIASTKRAPGLFFLARILRIAPMYYLLTALSILLGCAYEPTFSHIIQSLLFIKYQWAAPVLEVGWTLDYEFIFYALCAFGLLITNNVKYVAIVVSLPLFCGTLILDFYLFPDKKYGLFMEFWYGIAVYFLIRSKFLVDYFNTKQTLCIKKAFLCVLIVFAIVISAFSILTIDANGKAYLRFITFGLPAALLVYLSILYEKLFGLRKFKVLLLLGASSYSIYLSHKITLFLYYGSVGIAKNNNILIDMVGFFISILIGIFIYLLVERPIMNLVQSFLKNLAIRTKTDSVF